MELLIPLAKELNRDNWPRVVRDLGVSGEISRIAGLWKAAVSQDEQAGSSGLRQEPPRTHRLFFGSVIFYTGGPSTDATNPATEEAPLPGQSGSHICAPRATTGFHRAGTSSPND